MAGSIRTEPVTREYEAGWERTFQNRLVPVTNDADLAGFSDIVRGEEAPLAQVHESTDDIVVAVAGDVDTDVKVERERERACEPTPYPCPRCGWHLKNSMDRCGNATCRLSRRG